MNVKTRWSRLSHGPNYKWLVVGLLFFAGFLNLEDRVVVFSVLPLIKRDLRLSDVHLGALMSVFLWVYASCSPFAGYFGDRLSRKRVLIGSLFLWSVVTIGAGLVRTPAELMATRVLLGVTQAFYVPVSMAILADFHAPATRGKAVAILVTGMNLGPILGGGAAGWIGDHYGWRPTLIVLGAAGLFLAVLLQVMLQDVAGGRNEVKPASSAAGGFLAVMKELMGIPSYWFIISAVAVFSLAAWMLITWLPIFLYETFGMNLAQSGFLGNLAITGPAFIGTLLGGVLSDIVGRDRPQRRMVLLLGFYALAIPWPLAFRSASSVFAVLASIFAFQLCRAFGELNCYPLVYDLVEPRKRSTAIGVSNLANTLMGGIGALGAGFFRQSLGFQAVFGMVPVLIALAVSGLVLSFSLHLKRDLGGAIPRCRAPVGETGGITASGNLTGAGE